jgi:hypothetical protein
MELYGVFGWLQIVFVDVIHGAARAMILFLQKQFVLFHFSKSILKRISLLYPFVDVYGIKITLTFWGNRYATMGQDCNSRSHVCRRIFAYFGMAKGLWA